MNSIRTLTCFKSTIGWVGFLDADNVLQRVRIGYPTERELLGAFANQHIDHWRPGEFQKRLKHRIEKLLSGTADDFLDVEIETDQLTEFQNNVVRECRQIPFAATMTYGQLATAAGRPKAARAVGTVMSKNRFPLIVPCHRVVAANSIGGFTAPQGLSTKQTLQEIEIRSTKKSGD